MPPPRLESPYFGSGEHGAMYARMAAVLAYTARRHCPTWDVRVTRITPPNLVSALGNPSHIWNTQKLEHWVTTVREAPDGAEILLLDCDMLVTRPLDPVWEQPFDLAYTVRTGARLPLNGGAIFLRVNDRTRAFMETFGRVNRTFLANARQHEVWRKKYAGMNQSAFGCVIETEPHGCTLLELPCREWNCEDTEWRNFDPAVTRLLHIKSSLRRSIFGLRQPDDRVAHLIALWRETEAELRAQEVQAS